MSPISNTLAWFSPGRMKRLGTKTRKCTSLSPCVRCFTNSLGNATKTCRHKNTLLATKAPTPMPMVDVRCKMKMEKNDKLSKSKNNNT